MHLLDLQTFRLLFTLTAPSSFTPRAPSRSVLNTTTSATSGVNIESLESFPLSRPQMASQTSLLIQNANKTFILTRIRAVFRRVAHLKIHKTKTSAQPKPAKAEPNVMKNVTEDNENDNVARGSDTFCAVDQNSAFILQPIPHSQQKVLGMDHILHACGSGQEERTSNDFNNFDFFGTSSETLNDIDMATGKSTDPRLGRFSEPTHAEPGLPASLADPGPFLVSEPVLQDMCTFGSGDSPPLPFQNLDSYLPTRPPFLSEAATEQAGSGPSGHVSVPESRGSGQRHGDSIMVGNDTLEQLGLGLSRSLTPRTAASRLTAVTAEIARQEEAPPSLPPTEVQPLPDKKVFPRTVHIPNDVDPLVRIYLEQRNNRICEFVGIHERKRNNVAAKRSRVTRLESLGSYERLYYEATAELRFYRLQAVCEGLDGGRWEALTDEQRARWHDYVIREALENKALNLREKRAAQRQNRTKGAARARGTASVKTAAQNAIIRRAEIAADTRMPMNTYLSREVDSWLSQRKHMNTEEVLATLDDDISGDWTNVNQELLDPEKMLELLDPVRETLSTYTGDIQDALIELVSRIETDDTSKPTDEQREELVAAIVAYVELAAAAGDSDAAMRGLLADADAAFEEFAVTKAKDKGCAYKKLSNLFGVKKTQRERQQRQQAKKK
ncbi:hypothetical protein JDV02_007949 [Purpureocillium takamizusanense]|uniref:Uncharacterized protein n=1 Tax=Purpureocillium takamizusanense TaxID=2060973 RepID=A0A9Q8QNJ0_9HYPO|nr:uncharacterized protein JDV02_007949 [Purpureocillium takamizusanense]UNI22021.1 hypothetical protein JDV02_007949 [Purpureocillium takamizusanense]